MPTVTKTSIAPATVIGAGNSFLATALSPYTGTNTPSIFRITACFVAAATLQITFDNGTTWNILNSNVALTLGCLFVFDIPVRAGDLVNFKTAEGVTVNTFRVDSYLDEG